MKTPYTGIGFLALAAVAAFGQAGQVGSTAYLWSGLRDLDSNVVNLQDFQGKVILLSTAMHSCGGCRANAPFIGAIAQKFAGRNFQGLGVFVTEAPMAAWRNFEALLKKNAPDLVYPLLHGIPASDFYNGGKWKPYDAGRDVYFVIDHAGKIVHRIDGNQGSTMGDARYKELEDAIAKALDNVPTTVAKPARGRLRGRMAGSPGIYGRSEGASTDSRGRRVAIK